MFFSAFNDSIECSLDFGPGSVTLTVKDLVEEVTRSSQEITKAAWILLLSQSQHFLKNHLARFPITPNEQETKQMPDDVLSSVGVQNMHTSGYQVSDLEDNEANWEDVDLNMDAKFRTSLGTPFGCSVYNAFEIGSMAENAILIDKQHDKENSHPLPTTPASERQSQTPLLLRSRYFETTFRNGFEYVYRNLFQ